ncbi:TIGR03943 family protein [Nocardioides sp. SYSU D00038]|uniref:TIGR03943 family putative permease subunit n=1 Tax=Nocardioides sp. SYSU D00038 TaxID=2812554 RepID=UPI0019681B35|nr:TIGR03943 family protein [Nocardioides sp. SYSU D00038]
MTRPTQGIVLAFLGAVLLRLALGDGYLRYVTAWMRWPLIASGVLLLLLAIGPVLAGRGQDGRQPDGDPHAGDDGHGHGHDHGAHGVPASAWLILLPGLVLFTIYPPELGSYLAERRANQAAAAAPGDLQPLQDGGVVAIPVQEFVWRAQSGGTTLVERDVELVGFVTHEEDAWFVTRLTLGCCAADALAFRVEVRDADRPPRDQWVSVVGRYVEGSGSSMDSAPVMAASEVTPVDKPRQTYE